MTTSDTTTAPAGVAAGVEPGARPVDRGQGAPSGMAERPRSAVGVRPHPARARTWRLLVLLGLTVLGAGLFAAGGVAYTKVYPPGYSSEALIAMLPDPSTTVVTATSTTTTTALSVSSDYTGIWVQIGNSDVVRAPAAKALGVSVADLTKGLTVAPGSTSAALVSVKAKTSDPARSARWANAVAAQLVRQSTTTPVPGFSLRTVASATPATSTSGLAPSLVIGGAAVVGAVAGFALGRSVNRRARRRAQARA